MKEQEQAKVDHFMQAIDELNQLAAEPVAPIDAAKLDVDSAQSELTTVEAKALALKEVLAKTEEPTTGLSKDEEAMAAKGEENAREYLKRLLAKCGELQRQIDLIGELHKQDNALKGDLKALGEDVHKLLLHYKETPQSLLTAEDDLRKVDAIKARLQEANQQLHAMKAWASEKLANNGEAESAIKETENTVNELNDQLQQLIVPLQQGVELARSQLAQKDAIADEIKKMTDSAKRVHSLEKAEEKAAELKKLHERIEPLQVQLMHLQSDAALQPSAYVMPLDAAQLNDLGKNVETLQQLLSHEEMDAARKLNNASATTNISHEVAQLHNTIQKAEKIDADPNVTPEDLHKAKAMLEGSRHHLDSIQQISDTLDPSDADANQIRNTASDEHARLGEALSILLQSLHDRIEALAAFNEERQRVDAELAQLMQQLESSKVRECTSEELQKLLQANENLTPRVASLTASTDALKPLAKPAADAENILRRHNDIGQQIRAAKESAAEAERHRVIVQVYSEQIDAADEQAQRAEQAFEAMRPNTNELKQFQLEILQPILQQHQQLQSTEAPSDQLKRRNQQLKNLITKLQAKVEEKLKKAEEQERLVNNINTRLAQNEAILADLLSRYDEQPQPMEAAAQDVNTIEKLKEEIVGLPLDEITEKPVREQFSHRLDPLHVESNVRTLFI